MAKKKLEFYETTRTDPVAVHTEERGWHDREHTEYRWRLIAANGRNLTNPGEWFTEQRGAYRNAITALGLIFRSDVTITDDHHRAAVAKMLARAQVTEFPATAMTPDQAEVVWLRQLDPAS